MDSTEWGELVNHPNGGELWRHKATGDHYVVKSTYQIWIHSKATTLVVVKTIRLRDQYEIDEPLGMFLWEWERLN